jgi:hypothetical protein
MLSQCAVMRYKFGTVLSVSLKFLLIYNDRSSTIIETH